MRKLSVLALLTALIATLAGCGSYHSTDEKYYLVSANIQLPYWKTASAGFIQAARDMKVSAETVGPDTYDPQAELQEFRRVAGLKPSGILISAADANLLKPEIDNAISQGIPILTMDSDSPGSKRLTFIGTNNYQAGLMGGEAAGKALNGKGTVIVFTMPGQANLDERLHGYRDAFQKYPGIKIARVVDMKGDPRVAFDTTQEIVNKKEKIDGFICLEAQGGKEVASVLEQSKIDGKVVLAMDTDPDTLDWINKGRIVATVAQKPYTMGYVGVGMLDDVHHNKPASLDVNWSADTFATVPAFVDTGEMLINKDNIGSFQSAQQKLTPAKKT